MTQFKLENHNAVALLARLRDGTHSVSKSHRRTAFRGLTAALKGLGLISAKDSVQGLYEGLDHNGDHWFMADLGDESRGDTSTLCELDYRELCSIAQSLELVNEGQDPYFQGLAKRLTAITSKHYHKE